jgi:hypothetical protein
MRRFALALSLAAVAVLTTGCHLGDSADPVKCESGQHPSDGHCVLDAVAAATVTITPGAGGAACTVSPDSITVAANAEFELKNDDDVEHVVTGADGQAWASVKAHQLSPLIGITKAGSWAYTVSGCSKGGTVVVQ